MLVAVRVQGLREDVLAEVVRQLLLVGEIAVARVEALRKQQQGPDPTDNFIALMPGGQRLIGCRIALPEALNVVALELPVQRVNLSGKEG